MSQATTSSNHRKNFGDILVTSIMFNDSSATNATSLASYEEGSFTARVAGPNPVTLSTFTIKFVRNGKNVTLNFPQTTNTSSSTASTIIVLDDGSNNNPIPTRLRPAGSNGISTPISVTDSNLVKSGNMFVPGAAGLNAVLPMITLYTGGTFTVSALCGFPQSSVSYSIA